VVDSSYKFRNQLKVTWSADVTLTEVIGLICTNPFAIDMRRRNCTGPMRLFTLGKVSVNTKT
jgi:hypothetical protein